MNDDQSPAAVPSTHLATTYLANERTFLAWVRTSIALVSLGFAVAKFDIWFRELDGRSGTVETSAGWSVPMGLSMIAIGGLLPILSAWHYHATNKQIANGNVVPNRGLVHLITAVVVTLAIVFIGYFVVRQRAFG